jgi:hypothetical protein
MLREEIHSKIQIIDGRFESYIFIQSSKYQPQQVIFFLWSSAGLFLAQDSLLSINVAFTVPLMA